MKNFSFSFQLKKTRTKGDGTTPIYARVTVDGKRKEFSINRSILCRKWDYKIQKAKGKSESAQVLNNYLEELHVQVFRIYNKYIDSERLISVEDFNVIFNRDVKNSKTLVDVFKEHNILEKHKLSQSTYNQYVTTLERLKKFIKAEYKIDDIELLKLDLNFINRFENYLGIEYSLSNVNTINKYLKQLKKVIHRGIKLGYLKFDPFIGYEFKYDEVEREYLTADEVAIIQNKHFRTQRLEIVKDLFVFVCYTGLTYGDLKDFNKDYISIDIDGQKWIKFKRNKTNIKSAIPLLPQAQAILDKYSKDPQCIADEKMLPIRSNNKLNTYLVEIAELCEIDKHITMHIGRHTFATSIALDNGVSMESLKLMLGHKNINTTQIYGRTTEKKVASEMGVVLKKINDEVKLKSNGKAI